MYVTCQFCNRVCSKYARCLLQYANIYISKGGYVCLQLSKGVLAGTQITTEYRHPVYTASLTVANPDLVNDSGILVANLLRRVHPRLDLGIELMYQYGRMIPQQQFSLLSYAARYNGTRFSSISFFVVRERIVQWSWSTFVEPHPTTV